LNPGYHSSNLSRSSSAGYDVYRDFLNTPAFFAMLPDVDGLSGLDIGSGEGHNTRLLAQRRALVTAIDISKAFIAHAKQLEEQEPLGEDSRIVDVFDHDCATASHCLRHATQHCRRV
jgi:2-polyprenyl-3-methyl-5-hydroxy-6-metoxy-1,4-benzoquinol methylase